MLTLARNSNSWQLVLADLALILFLVCAAALSAGSTSAQGSPSDAALSKTLATPQSIAAAQALYRAGPDVPSLAEWLESQPRDPRAALTIIAEHTPDKGEQAWDQAREMANAARALDVRTRVIIRQGATNAVHASLAYDQPVT